MDPSDGLSMLDIISTISKNVSLAQENVKKQQEEMKRVMVAFENIAAKMLESDRIITAKNLEIEALKKTIEDLNKFARLLSDQARKVENLYASI